MANRKAGSFIKIDRKILGWRWINRPNYLRVWLHLLLNANYQDGTHEGVVIRRGEVAVSIPKLAREVDLTTDQVKNILRHLRQTGEVTCRGYHEFTVISMPNYDLYQGGRPVKNPVELPVADLSADPQVTHNQRNKEINNIINKEVAAAAVDKIDEILDGDEDDVLRPFGGIGQGVVMLSDKQVDDLLNQLTLDEFDTYVSRLANFIVKKKAKPKSHYKTILKWVAEDRRVNA